MKIQNFEYPPNIEEIKKILGSKRGIVYTYGDTAYNPQGVSIPEDLFVHEETHTKQQTDPVKWWNKYLKDPKFRLEQELEAYRAQYKMIKSKNRKERRFSLKNFAKALSGKMYGNIISLKEAERLICES